MNAFWDRFLSAMSGYPVSHTATWQFSRKPASLRKARRLTRQKLAGWGFEDQSDVVELLVSELVGNAMEHTDGTVRLILSVEDGLLRGEVEDEDPALPHLCEATLDDERGRGLHLVDMLSCCWGGARTSRGKVVWFELPTLTQPEEPLAAVVTPSTPLAVLSAEPG
ncbi:ATP-binding protein [Nonomuraea lactucae]|uniref:ATP-binding protein n=1 Tax=Nonomuraea lactucae TaxID=2249762 RepID=UPI000DE48DAF|nr:ATP-binding protein [Nonomuraea lactucae]